MTGKEHAKLLGLLMWIFAGLQIFVIVAVGLIWGVAVGAIFSQAGNMPQRPGEPPVEAILGFIVFVMVIALGITILFTIPKLVAGYGLRKGKSWAKVWTIVACVLAIMSVPLGTAVGVYGLWFVFGDQGKAYFDGPDFQPQASAQAPPPNSWQ